MAHTVAPARTPLALSRSCASLPAGAPSTSASSKGPRRQCASSARWNSSIGSSSSGGGSSSELFLSLPSSSRAPLSRAETTYGDLLVSKLVTGARGIDMELFGPSPHDCRRVTNRLRQAKTMRELGQLLPETVAEWQGMDTIALSAALAALARVWSRCKSLNPKPNEDRVAHFLGVLVQLCQPRLAELDAHGLVTVAVSLAKLQEVLPSHLSAAPAADTDTAAAATTATTAVPSVAALSSLSSFPLSPPASSLSAHHAAGLSLSGDPAPSPAARSSLLAPIFNQVLHYSLFMMPSFTPQAMANLIWALATVGHQPCGAWLTEFYRCLDEKVEVLKSQDVANVMWSLCKLDLMPDIWLRDSLVERALGAVREQGQDPGSSGQDPATLIQCLARWYFLYNYRVSDEWLSEYLRIVQPAMGTYLPFDLVSIVHSCVVMSYLPSRSWMASYYSHIMRSLKHDPTLSYSDFQRLMWALSRIDYTPPLSWQREFVAVSIPKLRHLKVRALSELVWALACWDCRPSPEWLAAFFNASGPRLRDARPQTISCQLSALAKLDVRAPGPWLDEALSSFCDQLSQAKAHDLVTLLDTITVVCMDRSWLLGHTDTIKALADTAASKFSVLDAVLHTKLCVALAAANVCPAADWLKKQQEALVAVLRNEDPSPQTTQAAQGLGEVYRTWDVEVSSDLKPFL